MKKISIALFAILAVTMIMGSCKKEELPNPNPTQVVASKPTIKFETDSIGYIGDTTTFQKTLSWFNLRFTVECDKDDVINTVVVKIGDADTTITVNDNKYTFDIKKIVIGVVGTYNVSVAATTKGNLSNTASFPVYVVEDVALDDIEFEIVKHGTAPVDSLEYVGLLWNVNVSDGENLYAVIEPAEGFEIRACDSLTTTLFDSLTVEPYLINLANSEYVEVVESYNEISIVETGDCNHVFIVNKIGTNEFIACKVSAVKREGETFTLIGKAKYPVK